MKKKVIASLLAMFIGGIAVFAQDPMVDKKNTDSKPPYIYPEESIVTKAVRVSLPANWRQLMVRS
mgnify:CR=1 FL=1